MQSFVEAQGADLCLTDHPRHASHLAAEAVAGGYERVIAVGGDGTMNEVAAALVGTKTVLGLVPSGSGDGLGRHLGIHGSLAHVFRILREGRTRVIDTGVANGHPFFCVAGIGFEAEIAQRFMRASQRGLLGYVALSAGAFRQWQPQEYSISHDAGRETIRAFTLAVANSGQYGNNAHIAPAAQVDDGLLDLVAVPPITLWNAAPLVGRLFARRLGGGTGVAFRRAARFVVEQPAPGWLQTDGEVHTVGTSIEFLVRPQSLRILCPDFPPSAENR